MASGDSRELRDPRQFRFLRVFLPTRQTPEEPARTSLQPEVWSPLAYRPQQRGSPSLGPSAILGIELKFGGRALTALGAAG